MSSEASPASGDYWTGPIHYGAMMPKTSKSVDTDIELRSDGWERFKTAVLAAAKSGPKPLKAKKQEVGKT